tara:strand:- start:830 stop:1363 length:534 start_codon:yes stop_codon:yes gene_type:complete
MKLLKLKNVLATFIIGAMAFQFTSCEIVNDTLSDEQKVDRISSIVKSGTQMAVSAVVLNKPELKKHFKTATLALEASVGADKLDPKEVLATLQDYFKEVPDGGVYYPLIESAISLGLSAYQSFYEANLDKNVKPYLKKFLVSIKEGIELGIGETPAGPPQGVAGNPILDLTTEDLTL